MFSAKSSPPTDPRFDCRSLRAVARLRSAGYRLSAWALLIAALCATTSQAAASLRVAAALAALVLGVVSGWILERRTAKLCPVESVSDPPRNGFAAADGLGALAVLATLALPSPPAFFFLCCVLAGGLGFAGVRTGVGELMMVSVTVLLAAGLAAWVDEAGRGLVWAATAFLVAAPLGYRLNARRLWVREST